MALPDPGTRVTAKRLGWNEELTAEQLEDMDPREPDDAGDDLEGELNWWDVPATDEVPAMTVCLVDGKPADPETVEPV